jgi:hypothetical protein
VTHDSAGVASQGSIARHTLSTLVSLASRYASATRESIRAHHAFPIALVCKGYDALATSLI